MFPALSKVQYGETTHSTHMGTRLKRAEVPIALTDGFTVGVDPGRNFGITLLSPKSVVTLWGTFPQQKEMWRYGAYAISLCKFALLDMPFFRGIVEGAAYRSKFGQVGLAEVRFGFAYGIEQAGGKAEIVAPMKIRKAVLGNGRGPVPYENWPTLNTNAVDSLITAVYALTIDTD